MQMPQLPPGFNRDEMKGTFEQSLQKVNRRYRFFAGGFILGIGSIAASLYFIHPALAATVVSTYFTYFMRVNLLACDDSRTQLSNGIAALKFMPDKLPQKEVHGVNAYV